jgi:hypothetical protein
MKLICPKKSNAENTHVYKYNSYIETFGVTKNTGEYIYSVNNLDYNVYDANDISLNTVNGLTSNNNKDTISYFYNYQIIKLSYDEFSFDNNTTTTYKIVPSSTLTSKNILEGQTLPPILTNYLAGGCFSNPITNSINYLSSNVNNDYTVTQNFPTATAPMHIGTIQPLSTGLILKFNKNEVKIMKDDNTYVTIGNVQSNGKVYSYGNTAGPFGTPINFNSRNWHTGTIISSLHQSKTYTTNFEKYIGYKIKNTKENKNEVKMLDNFKFTFNEYENIINKTTLIQNGVNSPEVNSIKTKSINAISTVTPTKPYAVFHAIIPYSFINMFPYFYNYNSNAHTGSLNITINNINNNGLILYVPTLTFFTEKQAYNNYRTKYANEFVEGVIRRINIKFNGVGIVTIATTSINDVVISDDNVYGTTNPDNTTYLDWTANVSAVYYIPDGKGTLYRNGNNTNKYATQVSVDNSIITIKMLDFAINPKKGPTYYIPRLNVIC